MSKTNSLNWLKIIQLGLIGGVVGVLIALVGMVEEFDKRDIVAGVLSMGWTMLLITVLVTAYFAAHSTSSGGLASILTGGIAGLVFSAVMSLLVLAVDNFNLRPILVNASPPLVRILTLEREIPSGLIFLLVFGALAGAAGGVIYILPAKVRNAVFLGLSMVAFLGLMQDILSYVAQLPSVGFRTRVDVWTRYRKWTIHPWRDCCVFRCNGRKPAVAGKFVQAPGTL